MLAQARPKGVRPIPKRLTAPVRLCNHQESTETKGKPRQRACSCPASAPSSIPYLTFLTLISCPTIPLLLWGQDLENEKKLKCHLLTHAKRLLTCLSRRESGRSNTVGQRNQQHPASESFCGACSKSQTLPYNQGVSRAASSACESMSRTRY